MELATDDAAVQEAAGLFGSATIIQAFRFDNRDLDAAWAQGRGPHEKLWHGTGYMCLSGICSSPQCTLCGILKHGFRPDLARQETHSYKEFGPNTWFAVRSQACAQYAVRSEREAPPGSGYKRMRSIILADVRLGKPFVTCRGCSINDKATVLSVDGKPLTNLHAGPPDGNDTVIVFPRGTDKGTLKDLSEPQRHDTQSPPTFVSIRKIIPYIQTEQHAHILVNERKKFMGTQAIPRLLLWYAVDETENEYGDCMFCPYHGSYHGCGLGCDGCGGGECCEGVQRCMIRYPKSVFHDALKKAEARVEVVKVAERKAQMRQKMRSSQNVKAPLLEAESFAYEHLQEVAGGFSACGAPVLGEGAMGIVYRAALVEFGLEVAIKVFKDRQDTAAFEREVQALARLRHPNIVHLIGVATDGPTPCLVMALMPGGSLRDRLVRPPSARDEWKPLSWKQRLLALRDAARGLAFLHMKKTVHRDVKAANILIDAGTSRAVLTDFSLVRDARREGGVTNRTRYATGTDAYMSPEALKGKVTTALDVYSLGITVLETLAGCRAEGDGSKSGDLFLEVEEALEELDDNPAPAMAFVDPSICSQDATLPLFGLVRECTITSYRRRPEAADVAQRLDAHLHAAELLESAEVPRTGSEDDGRANWESKDSKGLDEEKLFAVLPGSHEFVKIETGFRATMHGRFTRIVRIERVENGFQHEAHALKARTIARQIGSAYDPATMRRTLYHGTRCRGDVVAKIVHDPDAGFLPLKSGDRTGAIWGDGTYFARDAKYSDGYASVLPSGEKQMLAVDVVVGRWTQGHQGLNVYPHVGGELYVRHNSLVNNVANPSIFVIQHSSQAYPAYLITYV